MKKIICLLSLFSICTGMLMPTTSSLKAAEQKEEQVSDYEIEKITGEENIKEYQESLGEEYDPDIVEIYRVIDANQETTATNQTRMGNDYYTKGTSSSTATDTKKLLGQWKRSAGTVSISQTVSASNTYTASAGIKASMLTATLGFNVTASKSFSVSWSNKYSYPVTISVYPVYETIKGQLWEDDVLFDDYLGTFTVKKVIGDDIRVKKTT